MRGGANPLGGSGKGQAQTLSEGGKVAFCHPFGERKEVGRDARCVLQTRNDLTNLCGLAAGFGFGRDGDDKTCERAASERDAHPHAGRPNCWTAGRDGIREDAVETAGDGDLEILGQNLLRGYPERGVPASSRLELHRDLVALGQIVK